MCLSNKNCVASQTIYFMLAFYFEYVHSVPAKLNIADYT
uniref:Uncharacterized protein n=1 Tax=Saccharolobus solfataricus (strain 98/2) TaxID=555311 RepID=D0KVD0_SACS9